MGASLAKGPKDSSLYTLCSAFALSMFRRISAISNSVNVSVLAFVNVDEEPFRRSFRNLEQQLFFFLSLPLFANVLLIFFLSLVFFFLLLLSYALSYVQAKRIFLENGEKAYFHGLIYLCNSCGTRESSVSFDEACPAESRPVRLIT